MENRFANHICLKNYIKTGIIELPPIQLKIPNKEDEINASLIQCKFFAVEWLMAEVFSFFL